MTTLTEDYWLVDIIHNNQQIGDVSERVRTLFTVHITTDLLQSMHNQPQGASEWYHTERFVEMLEVVQCVYAYSNIKHESHLFMEMNRAAFMWYMFGVFHLISVDSFVPVTLVSV